MNFWHVILLFAAMAGLMGWWRLPFWNGVLWYCDWKDGADLDWGVEMFSTIAVPFAYMFAIFEIILIFGTK
ncbi:MAG: hypothetical protein K2Y22_12285 [Candidatus Obscuribacterales bacterium]|nr:hypothetical protein [Candidatus Obscuribacterales bacterium]